MDEFPVKFDDMKAAFFRGEFAQVISMLDGLRDLMPADDLPMSVFGYGGLARYYSEDFLGATIQYSEALRLNPDCIAILSNFAELLGCCPDPDFHDAARAVKLAERACELSNWSEHKHIGNLAAAYARSGQFEKAESYILLAMKVGPPVKQEAYMRHLCTVRNHQAITGDVIEDFRRLQREYGVTN